MNWKEQLRTQFWGYKDATELPASELKVPSHLNEFRKEIESFISTEIIEKLGQDFGNIIMEERYSDREERLLELREKWLIK